MLAHSGFSKAPRCFWATLLLVFTGSSCRNYKIDRVSFPITVDYDRTVEDGIKAGRYVFVAEPITARNFPSNRSGKTTVVIELIHLNAYIFRSDVTATFNKMGLRPADLRELMALREQYPKLGCQVPPECPECSNTCNDSTMARQSGASGFPDSLALGSVWHDSNYPNLAYMTLVPSLRTDALALEQDSDWGGEPRWFAAVRK